MAVGHYLWKVEAGVDPYLVVAVRFLWREEVEVDPYLVAAAHLALEVEEHYQW